MFRRVCALLSVPALVVGVLLLDSIPAGAGVRVARGRPGFHGGVVVRGGGVRGTFVYRGGVRGGFYRGVYGPYVYPRYYGWGVGYYPWYGPVYSSSYLIYPTSVPVYTDPYIASSPGYAAPAANYLDVAPGEVVENPALQPENRANIPMPDDAAPPKNAVVLQVRVPQGAEVWVSDRKTTLTGGMREFVSPPLVPGKEYTYRIRARWLDNGRPMDETRKVAVQAGQRVAVDFLAKQGAQVPGRDRADDFAQTR